jgi:uroporphyrin-III C-methyltransferase
MGKPPSSPLLPGTVYLVGAGPGDPELLTRKAHRLLRAADAVVYDYLVTAAILAEARPGCERVFVGKKAGHRCRQQTETDAILVALARQGKTVVRLKGGDPFIFGRGGEEADALAAAGIPFEVVPGITAALGTAAFLGIPLTHRVHSSAVVFLTGHEYAGKPEASVRWEDYARLNATLCIYMGRHRLETITRRLQNGGLSPNTPAAIVQAATTQGQREVFATLGTLAERSQAAGIASPAMVIIGEVAAHRVRSPARTDAGCGAIFFADEFEEDCVGAETVASPAGVSNPGRAARSRRIPPG